MAIQFDTDQRPGLAEPGLSELLSGIVRDAQDLVRQQLNLFQVELRNDLRKTVTATIPLVAGLVVVLLSGIIGSFAIAHALSHFWPALPLWGAYAIVTGALLAIGGGLVLWSRSQFKTFSPLPEQSLEGLKENIQWKTKR